MSSSSASMTEVSPASAYIKYVYGPAKTELFAPFQSIDPDSTALFSLKVSAFFCAIIDGKIKTQSKGYEYVENLSCLQAKNDLRKLHDLLRKVYVETTPKSQQMTEQELKLFEHKRAVLKKRFNTKEVLECLLKEISIDSELRKGNWIKKIEQIAMKSIIGNFLACKDMQIIYRIVVKIDYVNRDALENIITRTATLDLQKQCNTCKKFMTSAHKLNQCVRCSTVFHCNDECYQKDSQHATACASTVQENT